MHRDISDEELELWLDGEKYVISYDNCEIIEKVVVKNNEDGCICAKCGDMFPYAEPNQKDGTFKCWGCRQ